MNRQAYQVVAVTEKNVKRLVDVCRKNGPLYQEKPQIVAHVSRTSKWLLNALSKLHVHVGREATAAQ